ncbi:hypothetical protein A0H81_04057 [Grifola frondosa]|uniref:Uncharacterized protein n=1 Tax=Grifola frondosa TaxID=5627 RepID=A0A1C7MHB0_GRIFR|nr:hypothetical protein A0H81_04057 [Grifola frondosa]
MLYDGRVQEGEVVNVVNVQKYVKDAVQARAGGCMTSTSTLWSAGRLDQVIARDPTMVNLPITGTHAETKFIS